MIQLLQNKFKAEALKVVLQRVLGQSKTVNPPSLFHHFIRYCMATSFFLLISSYIFFLTGIFFYLKNVLSFVNWQAYLILSAIIFTKWITGIGLFYLFTQMKNKKKSTEINTAHDIKTIGSDIINEFIKGYKENQFE